MKVVTLRNLPPELVRVIRQRAREKGTSINKTVIALLQERTGRKGSDSLHHDLDALAGSWTPEESAAFEKALDEQRRIEPEAWK